MLNILATILIGQRRRRDRQDQANPSHHTLPREHTTGPGSDDGGEARRLSGRNRVLASWEGRVPVRLWLWWQQDESSGKAKYTWGRV